jgi:hypothetical protein
MAFFLFSFLIFLYLPLLLLSACSAGGMFYSPFFKRWLLFFFLSRFPGYEMLFSLFFFSFLKRLRSLQGFTGFVFRKDERKNRFLKYMLVFFFFANQTSNEPSTVIQPTLNNE